MAPSKLGPKVPIPFLFDFRSWEGEGRFFVVASQLGSGPLRDCMGVETLDPFYNETYF